MADFDPFANQGGPVGWDPEHDDDSKKLADELLKKLTDSDDEPGSGPSTFSGTTSGEGTGTAHADAEAIDLEDYSPED